MYNIEVSIKFQFLFQVIWDLEWPNFRGLETLWNFLIEITYIFKSNCLKFPNTSLERAEFTELGDVQKRFLCNATYNENLHLFRGARKANKHLELWQR